MALHSEQQNDDSHPSEISEGKESDHLDEESNGAPKLAAPVDPDQVTRGISQEADDQCSVISE